MKREFTMRGLEDIERAEQAGEPLSDHEREALAKFRAEVPKLFEKIGHSLKLLECEGYYRRTRNVLFAWEALVFARSRGIDVPAWALDALAGTGECLFETMPTDPREIAKLLGLGGRKGRDPAAFDRWREARKQIKVAHVVEELHKEGVPVPDVFHVAAERFGISWSTARDHYYAHQKTIRYGKLSGRNAE